jgi:hypothetical protein
LAKAKLATTPYNVKRACGEFSFIDVEFIPPGTKVDLDDYEGGLPDDNELLPLVDLRAPLTAPSPPTRSTPLTASASPAVPAALVPNRSPFGVATNSLRIKVPRPSQMPPRAREGTGATDPAKQTTSASKENARESEALPSDTPLKIHAKGFILRLLPTTQPGPEAATGMSKALVEENGEVSENEDEGKQTRRTFCPPLYRVPIVDMMERHYCAHPIILGYAAPNPAAIRRWAVHQIYNFCVTNELPEVWAYLWENWYRKGRWELWAWSTYSQIPVLKTTMILESQLVFDLF